MASSDRSMNNVVVGVRDIGDVGLRRLRIGFRIRSGWVEGRNREYQTCMACSTASDYVNYQPLGERL